MKLRKWHKEQIQYLKECLKTSLGRNEAIEKFLNKYPFKSAASVSTYIDRQRLHSLIGNEAKPIPIDRIEAEKGFKEKTENSKLRKEIEQLKSEIKEAHNRAATSEALYELIHEIKGVNFNTVPDWIHKPRNFKTNGTPSLMLSDLHFDEVVDPAQVNFMNEYGHDIAVKRINFTFEKATDILMNSYVNPNYDGFHLALNGDLLSGNIHEELRETNEQPIHKSQISLINLLIPNITNLADVFKNVFVTCLPGNHGRLDKKPRAKNRVFDNYEWVVYQMLARHFKDDPRIKFMIPDAYEFTYEIYNKRILQAHGDIFKGGNGIGGILIPILRGMAKKQQIYSAIGKSFDVMILGHFHQLIFMDNLIVNGTTKGMDEYTLSMGFPFQEPQQALWINHPDHGMISRTKILCDSYKR